jgi:hypothetical protein
MYVDGVQQWYVVNVHGGGPVARRPEPAAHVSPFRFEGPVEPADLIGRERETAQVLEYARAGRAMSIAAPRRYGKTSLLRAVAARLEAEGGVVATVDLLGLDGPADFATRYATAWRRATESDRRLRGAVQRVLSGLAGLGVTVAGVGVQVSFARGQDSGAVLHTVLDLPRQVDKPVLVVLDEFQALHEAWPQGEGVLRGHVQQQLGRASYVFAGSQPHLLAAAFADSGRAFYNQVLRVPLGRLPGPALADAFSARFAQTGRDAGAALSPLLALADGHPQRAMFLAHLLWERTPQGGTADDDTWRQALTDARRWVADEMAGIWGPLSRNQQVALRAVAEHGSATVAAAADSGVPRSARQAAETSLLRLGLVEVDESRTGPRGGARRRLVDPMLADWVLQRRGKAG